VETGEYVSKIKRASSISNSIDSLPLKGHGWQARLEYLVKRFVKWLVHWNTRRQAEFNQLVVDLLGANLETHSRLEGAISTLNRRITQDEVANAWPAGQWGSAGTTSRPEGSITTPDEINRWIGDPEQWPTADSYDPATLEPCEVLLRREVALKQDVPEWFWQGEEGSSLLSIGTGKAYFERKHWSRFEKVYAIDPSEKTRLSLAYFPIPNTEWIGGSIFYTSPRLHSMPKYGWLGACIHYLFGEFHGWWFMQKLAMMVSDTLVIDAGVFDSDSVQGKYLLELWQAEDETHEDHRRSRFSYEAFLRSIQGLWEVVSSGETAWVGDGRRSLILKRILPPVIQKSELGDMKIVARDKPVDNSAVYRTREGYFKESGSMGPLLMYQVVARAMGWLDMMRWRVYEGDDYLGFVTKDYGDVHPNDPSVSERLLLRLRNWSLPLGLLAADVARKNICISNGEAVWIDVTLVGLHELDASGAIWATANTYKQYEDIWIRRNPTTDPSLTPE
jgi:hypothetical protein